MIRGGFLSAEGRAHLEALVRRPSEKHGVARRANAILLLDDGMNCEDVARVLYLDDDTVRGWHQRFATDGVAALRAFGWKGGEGRLSRDQESALAAALSEGFYASTAAVIALIEKRFSITYSKAGVLKLLHRLGFVYAKPKGLPAKADAAAQEAFVAHYERLMNGLLPDEVVYFSDAVHPEYQSRPAHGWIRRGERPAVRKGKGRQRLNLMGALNLENFDLRLVETLKMSTQTTIDLLAQKTTRGQHRRAHRPLRAGRLDNFPRQINARHTRKATHDSPLAGHRQSVLVVQAGGLNANAHLALGQGRRGPTEPLRGCIFGVDLPSGNRTHLVSSTRAERSS
jgi:transposase